MLYVLYAPGARLTLSLGLRVPYYLLHRNLNSNSDFSLPHHNLFILLRYVCPYSIITSFQPLEFSHLKNIYLL